MMLTAMMAGMPANTMPTAIGLGFGSNMNEAAMVGFTMHMITGTLIGTIFGTVTGKIETDANQILKRYCGRSDHRNDSICGSIYPCKYDYDATDFNEIGCGDAAKYGSATNYSYATAENADDVWDWYNRTPSIWHRTGSYRNYPHT